MTSKKVFHMICFALLLLFGFITFFPIYMALLNSLKSQGEMFTSALALPSELTLNNYIETVKKMDIFRNVWNTLVVTVVGQVGIIFCASLAGWKLSRTSGKLSNFIFILFLSSMLIPFNAIMVTLTQVASDLKLTDSLVGLGLIYVGLGTSMALFLYHGFVKTVPYELEESARIDGCGEFQIFFRIVFPLLKPITATILILNSLWIWNDFLLPMVMISNVNNQTLILSINRFFGEYTTDWPRVLAGLIMTSIPVVIFYIIFQKNIMSGIAEGAIKS